MGRPVTAGQRVQDRQTGATGTLLNAPDAPVAIVHWDAHPLPTWADWSDLA